MHLIQIIMSYLGVSQQELARRVGITQAICVRWKSNRPMGDSINISGYRTTWEFRSMRW